MNSAIEFDFETRTERAIPVEEASAACQRGLRCWIDVDASDRQKIGIT